jgi:hypothetical protein
MKEIIELASAAEPSAKSGRERIPPFLLPTGRPGSGRGFWEADVKSGRERI